MPSFQWEKEMLAAAREHLKATEEERWADWRRIGRKRRQMYQAFSDYMQSCGWSGLPGEIETELRGIDQSIVSLIREKKEAVSCEIASLRVRRNALGGYRKGAGGKPSTRGFQVVG